ncbi:hypothetical protein ACHHYP_11659 [Achlya hypogyna]|uniref:Uncharacterized protein n=1 Tax=Achlya hypogyna TaxID=1202772 RepID=A0A1V9YIR2_ACHHY|nr:hypothetical protein ACHHYP_11659 [Achlya hypogyna]
MPPISLQLKKRKRGAPKDVAGFLSHSELEAMTEYEYADTEASAPPKVFLASLEDTAHKVRRLQDEGNVLAGAERYRAAIDRWRQGLEYDPSNGVLFELIAQAHLALGEYFLGISVAQRAVELMPNWSDAHVTLSRCQFNYGELDLALTSLRQQGMALADDPSELQPELDEIAALAAERDTVVARGEALMATLTRPDEVQVAECKTNLARRLR